MSVSASSSSSPQRSALLRALDRYQLPTPPASQETITHGAVARALLSDEYRERLEALCLKPIPPAVAPRQRAGVAKQTRHRLLGLRSRSENLLKDTNAASAEKPLTVAGKAVRVLLRIC
jgi:hypothetical protein